MGLERRLERKGLDVVALKEIANKMEKLEEWLANQHNRSSKLFSKYLHFSIDKDPY